MQFSQRFKQLCKQRGVTQKQALIDMGMRRNAAQSWTEFNPSVEALLKLARYFDMTTDEVLGVETTTFYDIVNNLCSMRNTTITKMAEDIGLSNAAPTSWKKGLVPKLSTVEKISQYFGVSADYLLGKEHAEATTYEKRVRLVFSERFKQLCKQRGVTQQKALVDMGFHKNAVQRWATGNPSADALLRIAQYFGITTDDLLGKPGAESPTHEVGERHIGDAEILRAFEQADATTQEAILLLLKLR